MPPVETPDIGGGLTGRRHIKQDRHALGIVDGVRRVDVDGAVVLAGGQACGIDGNLDRRSGLAGDGRPGGRGYAEPIGRWLNRDSIWSAAGRPAQRAGTLARNGERLRRRRLPACDGRKGQSRLRKRDRLGRLGSRPSLRYDGTARSSSRPAR